MMSLRIYSTIFGMSSAGGIIMIAPTPLLGLPGLLQVSISLAITALAGRLLFGLITSRPVW